MTPARAAVPAAGVAPINAATENFRTYVLNALFVPLFDDSASPRWADPALSVDCADGTVTVDGGRPAPGAPVPDAFTVHWRMDGCLLFGSYIEASGDVQLVARREGATWWVTVHPMGLKVHSDLGTDLLNDAFASRMAVGSNLLP